MFDFLFNPNGRISRKGYALAFFLPSTVLLTIPSMFLPAENGLGIYTTLLGLFFFFPSIVAVPIKRFHDLGLTGWFQLFYLIAIAVLVGYAMVPLFLEAMQNPSFAEELDQSGRTGWDVTVQTWKFMAETSPDRFIAMIIGTVVQYGQMVLFLILPGQRRANKYGNDPVITGRGFAD